MTAANRPPRRPGYVLLEDGTRFDGSLIGTVEAAGDLVFTTAMSGYQERVTDPSSRGQIVTFAYPEVGGSGAYDGGMESGRAEAAGVVMREGLNFDDQSAATSGWVDWLLDNGVAAIDGVDTRALIRHVRGRGSVRGGLFSAETDPVRAAGLINDAAVTDQPAGEGFTADGGGAHLALLDLGLRRSTLDRFRSRDCRLTGFTAGTTAETILAADPDLVLVGGGPGDPAGHEPAETAVRELLGQVPLVTLGLGHQLLGRVLGLETFRLDLDHRGVNHPVLDLAAGTVDITTQNHGFALAGPDGSRRVEASEPVRWDSPAGPAEITGISLFDRTIESLAVPDARAVSFQYDPPGGVGPAGLPHLLDRFLDQTGAA